jgi:hypothetical protein
MLPMVVGTQGKEQFRFRWLIRWLSRARICPRWWFINVRSSVVRVCRLSQFEWCGICRLLSISWTPWVDCLFSDSAGLHLFSITPVFEAYKGWPGWDRIGMRLDSYWLNLDLLVYRVITVWALIYQSTGSILFEPWSDTSMSRDTIQASLSTLMMTLMISRNRK